MIWAWLACSSEPVDTQMDIEIRADRVWFEGRDLGFANRDKGQAVISALERAAIDWGEQRDVDVVVRAEPDTEWRRVMEVLRTLDLSARTHTHLGLVDGPTMPLAWDTSCHHPRKPERVTTVRTSAMVVLRERGANDAQAWFGVEGEDGCVRPWFEPMEVDCAALFEGEEVAACSSGDGPNRVDLATGDVREVVALTEPHHFTVSAEGGVAFSEVLKAAKAHPSPDLGQAWFQKEGVLVETPWDLALARARWVGSLD